MYPVPATGSFLLKVDAPGQLGRRASGGGKSIAVWLVKTWCARPLFCYEIVMVIKVYERNRDKLYVGFCLV